MYEGEGVQSLCPIANKSERCQARFPFLRSFLNLSYTKNRSIPQGNCKKFLASKSFGAIGKTDRFFDGSYWFLSVSLCVYTGYQHYNEKNKKRPYYLQVRLDFCHCKVRKKRKGQKERSRLGKNPGSFKKFLKVGFSRLQHNLHFTEKKNDYGFSL